MLNISIYLKIIIKRTIYYITLYCKYILFLQFLLVIFKSYLMFIKLIIKLRFQCYTRTFLYLKLIINMY